MDNEDDDTVTFDMVNTFIFRPDLTLPYGLTGNEIVTVPHLLIMVSEIQTHNSENLHNGTVIRIASST